MAELERRKRERPDSGSGDSTTDEEGEFTRVKGKGKRRAVARPETQKVTRSEKDTGVVDARPVGRLPTGGKTPPPLAGNPGLHKGASGGKVIFFPPSKEDKFWTINPNKVFASLPEFG